MKCRLHKQIVTSSKLCEGYWWGDLMISHGQLRVFLFGAGYAEAAAQTSTIAGKEAFGKEENFGSTYSNAVCTTQNIHCLN